MVDSPYLPAAVLARQALRTPRAVAVAGIAFLVLLTVAFVLVRLAVPGVIRTRPERG